LREEWFHGTWHWWVAGTAGVGAGYLRRDLPAKNGCMPSLVGGGTTTPVPLDLDFLVLGQAVPEGIFESAKRGNSPAGE